MLYQGEDCQPQGLGLFIFSMTLYVMLRCARHSYHVFLMHAKKWKEERHLIALGDVPLPLIAAFWVFASPSFFTVCCIINCFRHFTAIPPAFEDFAFARLLPFCLGTGVLLVSLAASVLGLFWGEIALQQREIRTGRSNGRWAPSFKLYRLYCSVYSITYASVFAATNVVFGNSTITFVLLLASYFGGNFVCLVGACLVQWELAGFQRDRTEHGQQGLERVYEVFVNIRVAALKIVAHALLALLLLLAYTLLEASPYGAAPDIVVHLLGIFTYLSCSVTLFTMGEYLAAEKNQVCMPR